MGYTLQKVIDVLNQIEGKGAAHWQRDSETQISVWVRDPRMWGGSSDQHWPNAQTIQKLLRQAGAKISEPKLDRQSGKLVMNLKTNKDEDYGQER